MIDWLRASKSGHFYRKRSRLPKLAVAELFRALRQGHRQPSNNVFSHLKERHGNATWSAVSFFYEREPAFLEAPAVGHDERICGYLLIVEYRDHIAVFKSGLEMPAKFKTTYLDRVSSERVERAIAKVDAVFERIRLRNMASSRYALRSKTLEAADLHGVIGPSGARRYVAQGYRVRQGGGHFTATPSTGRIAERSEKSSWQELVEWTSDVIDQLHAPASTATSAFIRTFARPVDLTTLIGGPRFASFAVDAASIADDLFEADNPKRFVRWVNGNATTVSAAESGSIVDALEKTFEVRTVRGEHRLMAPGNRRVGTLAVGKTRIALKSFDLAEIQDVSIESAEGPLGTSADCVLLKRYIDHDDRFTVLFSDYSLAYIDGALYRDQQFLDGGVSFLKYFKPMAGLTNSTSEKGHFNHGQAAFDADSVFGEIVATIAAQDDFLVCDDLLDEWADFIGVCTSTSPKSISFYHAKHGNRSLGAGAFHVAVSQAIKNLGRLALSPEMLAAKNQLWASSYSAPNAQTAIPRVQRGGQAQFIQAIEDTRTSPDTISRVFIVTSSLSYYQLQQTFADINAGTAPRPHFVQLYWLLMSFFSACMEVGAFAYVVCQP